MNSGSNFEMDITNNISDFLINCNFFEDIDVSRDRLKDIFISRDIDINSCQEFVGKEIVPYVDIDKLCENIEKENINRDSLGLARICTDDCVNICKYINNSSKILGKEITEFISVLAEERSELSSRASNAANRLNTTLHTFMTIYKMYKEQLNFGDKSEVDTSTANKNVNANISNTDDIAMYLKDIADATNKMNDKMASADGFETEIKTKITGETGKQSSISSDINAKALGNSNWGSAMIDDIQGVIEGKNNLCLYGPSRSGKSKAVGIALARLGIEYMRINLNEYSSPRELVSETFTYGGKVGYKDTVFKMKLDMLENNQLDRLAVLIEDPEYSKFDYIMNSFKAFLGGSGELTIGNNRYSKLDGKLAFIVVYNNRGTDKFEMPSAYINRFISVDSSDYMDEVYEQRKIIDIQAVDNTFGASTNIVELIADTESIIDTFNNTVYENDRQCTIDVIPKLKITSCIESCINSCKSYNDLLRKYKMNIIGNIKHQIGSLRALRGIDGDIQDMQESLQDIIHKYFEQ